MSNYLLQFQPFIAHRGLYSILDTPSGRPPLISDHPTAYDTLFLAYDIPVHNMDVYNKGVEYTVNLPEWRLLRTSANISGAYIETRSYTSGDQVNPNFIFSHIQSDHVPIYQAGQGNAASQLNTSLRLILRVPEAGLVVSTLTQVTWIQRDRMIGYSPYPTGLLDRKGQIIQLDHSQASLPEYEIYWNRISDLQLLEEKRPPLWLFNLRINKEFRQGQGFAFYVNNFLNQRPLYLNSRTNTYSQRNLQLFFGAEIFYQL